MKIVLHDEGTSDSLDISEVARYLDRRIRGSRVERRGCLFPSELPDDTVTQVSSRIAGTKIGDVTRKLEAQQEPFYGEVEFERRRLRGRTKAFGIIYEGIFLQRALSAMLAPGERRLDTVHMVFSNRLFATWDNGDRRYHLRNSLYGMPSMISTSGIVEGPAKPRDYYLMKQQYEALKQDLTEVKQQFAGRFIDYDDERLTEVAKGLAAQAVAYALTGYPFCEDRGCRLFNAHWQEDLIYAQITSPYEFCPLHTEALVG